MLKPIDLRSFLLQLCVLFARDQHIQKDLRSSLYFQFTPSLLPLHKNQYTYLLSFFLDIRAACIYTAFQVVTLWKPLRGSFIQRLMMLQLDMHNFREGKCYLHDICFYWQCKLVMTAEYRMWIETALPTQLTWDCILQGNQELLTVVIHIVMLLLDIFSLSNRRTRQMVILCEAVWNVSSEVHLRCYTVRTSTMVSMGWPFFIITVFKLM